MHGLVSKATTGLSHHLSSQLDSCSAASEPLDDDEKLRLTLLVNSDRRTCDRYSASPESEGVPKKVQSTGIDILNLHLLPKSQEAG